jgi:hypothetical protein
VLEVHVRILRRNFDDRIHVAERGGEDELMAGACELFDGTLGVGTFGHVFQIGRFDPVAEGGDDRPATDLMLIGPAEIADRPEIDETDFQFACRAGLECRGGNCEQHNGGDEARLFHFLFQVGRDRDFRRCSPDERSDIRDPASHPYPHVAPLMRATYCLFHHE